MHEPGLADATSSAMSAGRLTAHENPEGAVSGVDAVLICVGTPLDVAGNADTSQVESACGLLATHPEVTVIVRSTLPLGASPRLLEWLHRSNAGGVATNPEFLRQGTAMEDFREPNRIVLGTQSGEDNEATAVARALYARALAPLLVVDFETAEMIKNAANAFLAAKLSFVNEIADLCEAYGADVGAVMRGVGLDPRIGSSYLRPGIGFGGSCLPKELANLARMGRRRDRPLHLIEAAAESNDQRPARIANGLEREMGPLAGAAVALLGLTFKPDTDDVRYSPALSLARELLVRGCSVAAHDPAAQEGAVIGIRGLTRVATAVEAIDGSDLVVLATEWPEYSGLDWKHLAHVARSPRLYDGRRALDAGRLRQAGWTVLRVGEAARSRHGG